MQSCRVQSPTAWAALAYALTALFCCYTAAPPGVMALQFHPEYANLLAVGCYDGSVAVYDGQQKTNKPLYAAAAKAKKHTDTVWQVCWQVRTS